MNREQKRANARAAQAARKGPAELPKTQVLLVQMLQQNQEVLRQATVTNALLEGLVRLGMKQSPSDVDYATGLSFPIPTKEERKVTDEARAKAADDRAAMAEGYAPDGPGVVVEGNEVVVAAEFSDSGEEERIPVSNYTENDPALD